uniref:Uncharacterized protein n=1 Tax=Romanomermis culicivorax TaxID=13658 RepID=A0A915J7M0_ROMCU
MRKALPLSFERETQKSKRSKCNTEVEELNLYVQIHCNNRLLGLETAMIVRYRTADLDEIEYPLVGVYFGNWWQAVDWEKAETLADDANLTNAEYLIWFNGMFPNNVLMNSTDEEKMSVMRKFHGWYIENQLTIFYTYDLGSSGRTLRVDIKPELANHPSNLKGSCYKNEPLRRGSECFKWNYYASLRTDQE